MAAVRWKVTNNIDKENGLGRNYVTPATSPIHYNATHIYVESL